MPFNQQISFPCELTLHHTTDGFRIFRRPIPEIPLLDDGEDVWINRPDCRPDARGATSAHFSGSRNGVPGLTSVA